MAYGGEMPAGSHKEEFTMKNRLVFVLAVAMGLINSASLFAHHGSSSIDSKEVTLKGTVTKWIYANPHLLLLLDVKGENGEVVHWVLESQSPTVMYPTGYRKDTFKPGDVVTVTVHPAKNGEPAGAILEAITADGKKLTRYRPQVSAEP
jgi:Family of unknown function (DUF6152)